MALFNVNYGEKDNFYTKVSLAEIDTRIHTAAELTNLIAYPDISTFNHIQLIDESASLLELKDMQKAINALQKRKLKNK
jgi:hypothetical protein